MAKIRYYWSTDVRLRSLLATRTTRTPSFFFHAFFMRLVSIRRLLTLAFPLAVLLAGPSRAQTTAAAPLATGVPSPHLILVTVNWWANLLGTGFLQATFDTGGRGLANLSEAELNKKYAKVPLPASSASIVNFVVQSGYRVVSFSTTQGGSGSGADANRVSITNGYVFLCEQVR